MSVALVMNFLLIQVLLKKRNAQSILQTGIRRLCGQVSAG
jgi:hypothetical protein